MVRPTINEEPKRHYTLSLNERIVDEFKANTQIQSISGWVEDTMLRINLSHKKGKMLRCSNCQVEAYVEIWARWSLKCMECKFQHNDTRQLRVI